MRITIDLADDELAEYYRLIRKIFNTTDDQLDLVVEKLTRSALDEYLYMLKEGGLPNRADEVKQFRLYFLINNYFIEDFPTEAQVSTLFQLTGSQSKTLIRNTLSRFRHRLDEVIAKTMVTVLRGAERVDEQPEFELVILSEILKDELNMIITQNEPTFRAIKRKPGRSSQYVISEDSYELLRAHFNME
ncbi:hypothetical protein J6J08_05960 [Pseudidiomarina sp. 1APR75-33.1]|uniref:hypothetical protein n=1 Tax=Pseudidiomarina terrestris TaxID=2820060 RepID=UPI00264C0C19|nr:hypothetical protein [Pseudidiomarina sp. 1APR75-33.1]MDN7126919.1 hypothetical protein [Pseudidiomarina sp. 1APR75-33.1]